MYNSPFYQASQNTGNILPQTGLHSNFYLGQTAMFQQTSTPSYVQHQKYLPSPYMSSPIVAPTASKMYFNGSMNSSGYGSNKDSTFSSPYAFPTNASYNWQNTVAQNQPSYSYNQNEQVKAPKAKKARKAKAQQDISLTEIINSVDVKQQQQFGEKYYEQDEHDDLSDNENYEFDSFDMSNPSKKKRVLNRNQRVAANVRERKRMNIMNDAFVNLRQILPIKTGLKRRKMSRLDIVIGALEYIEYLDSVLANDQAPGISNNLFQQFSI